MLGLFSSVSSKFNNTLILGVLLPTAVHILLGLILVVPLFPAGWSASQIATAIETLWIALAVSVITILLSGVLYNLNIPIIRFYEGYPWRNSWLGKKRTEYYRRRFEATQARKYGLRALANTFDTSLSDEDQMIIQRWWDNQSESAFLNFPSKPALILPTRLGNVVASFEDYPRQQYGIETVVVWPRLFAKIDTTYTATIADSKTAFDFMVNSSLLSTILGLVLLVVGLIYTIPWVSWQTYIIWGVKFWPS